MADLSQYSNEELLGMLHRRSSSVNQLPSTQQPVNQFTKVASDIGKGFLNFSDAMNPLKMPTPISVIPDRLLEPALSAGGAAAGLAIPVPFAATAGSGVGSLVGQAILQRRQQKRGEVPQQVNVLKSVVERPAETLTGAGVAKLATALPFLTPASSTVYGGVLKQFKNVKVPIGQTMQRLIMRLASKGQFADTVSGLAEDYANRFGATTLSDVLSSGVTEVSPVEAQHLVNTLRGSPATKSYAESISRDLFRSLPFAGKETVKGFARAASIKSGTQQTGKLVGRLLPWVVGGHLIREGLRGIHK